MLEGYRRMTPAAKFEKVRQLNLAVRQMATARITQLGAMSADEIRMALGALWLPPRLLREATKASLEPGDKP